MISLNAKDFYFFDWEIKLLEEIGFKFPSMEIANKASRSICVRGKRVKNTVYEYRVTENPKPIKSTPKRRQLLEELPYKMNAINVIFNSHETRSIKAK